MSGDSRIKLKHVRLIILGLKYMAMYKKKGGLYPMERKEIVFFDELGFGWLVDNHILKQIYACKDSKDYIVERTLSDILNKCKTC